MGDAEDPRQTVMENFFKKRNHALRLRRTLAYLSRPRCESILSGTLGSSAPRLQMMTDVFVQQSFLLGMAHMSGARIRRDYTADSKSARFVKIHVFEDWIEMPR